MNIVTGQSEILFEKPRGDFDYRKLLMNFGRSRSPYFFNLVYFGLVRLIVIGSGNANIEIAK